MKALIKEIGEKKMSRNGDCYFQRIKFMLEDGRFAMTDLVSNFRNFAWWKPVIEKGEGTWISNVFLKPVKPKQALKVNADSQIMICSAPIPPEAQEVEEN